MIGHSRGRTCCSSEEEPADIDTADSEGNDEYTQSEESVVEEEEVKEDKSAEKVCLAFFKK